MKTSNLLKILVTSMVLYAVVLVLTSCTVTTAPDGTVTKTVDQNAEAIAFTAAKIAIDQYNLRHPVKTVNYDK